MAQDENLPKDVVEIILLMQEFELLQELINPEFETAQAITAALRTQAVGGWGRIDGAISDKYLQVRKLFTPIGEEDDSVYIVDMEDVDLSKLASQF